LPVFVCIIGIDLLLSSLNPEKIVDWCQCNVYWPYKSCSPSCSLHSV